MQVKYRGPAKLDRDHRRAVEHRMRERFYELDAIDWTSVDGTLVYPYLIELCDILDDTDENDPIFEPLETLIAELQTLMLR